MEKVKGILKKIKSKPKLLIILSVVFVLIWAIVGGVNQWKAEKVLEEEENSESTNLGDLPGGSYTDYDQDSTEFRELYDQEIINKQEELINKYGSLPEGFLWDLDGSLVSTGDKDMTAEEVLYAYLNGIRTLNFESAQKFSRGSSVVRRYEGFYNSSESNGDTYVDNFYRNMYSEVLKSIQVKKVDSTAVFAANKQVFTVELELLDLSSKDFWEDDKLNIYNTLYIYSSDEDDSVKSEQWVYNYVMDYYKSPEAVTTNVTVNITVEKYARLDTGWLVTIDKDVDDYCYYTDGNVVSKYILRSFQEEGRELIREQRREEQEALKASNDAAEGIGIEDEVEDGIEDGVNGELSSEEEVE